MVNDVTAFASSIPINASAPNSLVFPWKRLEISNDGPVRTLRMELIVSKQVIKTLYLGHSFWLIATYNYCTVVPGYILQELVNYREKI